MPITPDDLAARAREHLTEQDESAKFTTERLTALIPSALAEWIRRTENDSAKRQNFIAQTASIDIVDGVANCLDAIEAKGIQSQFVPKGDITIEYDGSSVLPVQFVASLSRLTLGGIQDKYFITAYFDGKKMLFRNPADNALGTLDGTMTIRAVSVPRDLADIPSSVEGELASILAEIARKFNTDTTHKGEQINMQKAR